jgi:regulator of RNase E activity RraA
MLTPAQLDAIRQFDTCAISDAIEHFDIRLRNEGFTRPGLRCVTQKGARLLGYAATFRVRSSDPPVTGRAFLDRSDWWEDVARLPTPRIAVIRDLEPAPAGSVAGEVHAAVLKALRCDGLVTNGAVRDLPAVERLGFPMFAQYASVSHSYMHVVDYGGPVEILGLEIHNGDLIYADCHGVVSIPMKVADSVAEVAADIRMREARVVKACASLGASLPIREFREEILRSMQS